MTDRTDGPPRAADGYDFSGTAVLIAGGTSGVGLATATAFAQAGCRRLTVLGRNEERGKRAVEHVQSVVQGAEIEFLPTDANDPAAAEGAASEARRRMGSIDVLVNSTVATYSPTLLRNTPIEQVAQVVTEQSVGPLLMSRAVLPHMSEQQSGSVINIASDAAKVPTPGETCIGAAMSAIVTFSQTLALEAKRDGVRVNVITPSLITNTGSYDRAMSQEFSKKIFDRIVSQAHLGLTEPADLANLALFLASPMSRLITGQVVSVNGGISVA